MGGWGCVCNNISANKKSVLCVGMESSADAERMNAEQSRQDVHVDCSNTENRKTPDSSPICRAPAQDGTENTRESANLSTVRMPKTAKHPTFCLCVGRQPRTVPKIPERAPICRLIECRKPQNTRQFAYMSGASPGQYRKYPRAHQSVDCSNAEDRKTPDSLPMCRASAQDSTENTRERTNLSTVRIPKTAKHPTVRLCVGRQPRTVPKIPERAPICRLFECRKPQNTRQFAYVSGASPGKKAKQYPFSSRESYNRSKKNNIRKEPEHEQR